MINNSYLLEQWTKIIATRLQKPKKVYELHQNDIICIQKDIPRTFAKELTQSERILLKQGLMQVCEYLSTGYMSGYSFIFAFLLRLTKSNTQQSKSIFLYLFKQPEICLQNLFDNNQFLHRFCQILEAQIIQRIPYIKKLEYFSSTLLIPQIKCIFCHSNELSDFEYTALVWDIIINNHIFAIVEIIIELLKLKGQTCQIDQLLNLKINRDNIRILTSLKIQPYDYYLKRIR